MQDTSIRDFWNERATLGFAAGTNDIIAKRLEMDVIAEYVRDGMTILDFGCGNGVTALELAKKFNVHILGLDFSDSMISAAQANSHAAGLCDRVSFRTCDDKELDNISENFDLIYTERAIINLTSWEAQEKAIDSLIALLRPSGKYLMCECSQDGLNELNALRQAAKLPEMHSAWHNRYLHDEEVSSLALRKNSVELREVRSFMATYYFLSRVINAAVAKEDNIEPDYDSFINRLALRLPPVGTASQVKLWVWEKA